MNTFSLNWYEVKKLLFHFKCITFLVFILELITLKVISLSTESQSRSLKLLRVFNVTLYLHAYQLYFENLQKVQNKKKLGRSDNI